MVLTSRFKRQHLTDAHTQTRTLAYAHTRAHTHTQSTIYPDVCLGGHLFPFLFLVSGGQASFPVKGTERDISPQHFQFTGHMIPTLK